MATEGRVEISSQQRSELEAAVKADPGAPAFAALAELERRAGRPAESERIAREGLERKPEHRDGRIVLALALIDQGRVDEAHRDLWRLADDVLAHHAALAAGAVPLSDDELDRAFDGAETDADELIDPNRVAEEALSHVDRADAALEQAEVGFVDGEPATDEEAPELDAEADLDPATPDPALEPGSAFATATLADLLERQGDTRGAERIRRALARSAAPAAEAAAAPPEVAAAPDPALREAAPAAPESAASTTDRRSRVIATLERWLENLRGERA